MKGGTMFSGIGAPECAAPWIDWRWCAEIDTFPAAVHAARFPGVANHGDVTKVAWDAVEPVDVVVWGSPCQAFSVAGRRAGLDDPRGDLTLVGLAALGRIRPRWMVWENVPGVLSIDGGRTFGTVLGLMGELGYGVAYRVLDARHFGVPQRRRRVFVVGCLGDWRRAAAVLFDRDCLSGNPAPGREAREDVARPLAAGSPRGSGYRNDADTAENLIAHSLRAEGFDASEDGTGRGTPLVPATYRVTGNCGAYSTGDQVGALGTMTDPAAQVLVPVAMATDGHGSVSINHHATGALTAQQPSETSARQFGVSTESGVRRLTPLECERLQGFPDQWTAVTYRGKPAADGARYKAIGNSMAVPVLAWLLDRIRQVDALQIARAA